MQILNLVRPRPPPSNQQNLIELQNQHSQQIFKNRLFLTSLLNLLIFLTFLFCMAYYQWALISLPIYETTQSQNQQVHKTTFNFYANLLYVKQTNNPNYQTYESLSLETCIKNDIYCLSAFSELAFIGYLTFAVLVLGASFQIYDIYAMIRYFAQQKDTDFSHEKKDNLRHMLTIGHFLVGLTLNIFGLTMTELELTLGLSFWLFVAALLAFVIIILYEQLSLHKIHKQKLILQLMQAERQITHKVHKTEPSVELSSEGDFGL